MWTLDLMSCRSGVGLVQRYVRVVVRGITDLVNEAGRVNGYSRQQMVR